MSSPDFVERPQEKQSEKEHSSEQQSEDAPDHIDITKDTTSLFGKVVNRRENSEIFGLTGTAVHFFDGTIELTTQKDRVIYRPRPNSTGTYNYYDKNGNKVPNVVLSIDVEELFGSGKD